MTPHGTFTGYTRGCRCAACKEANRDHSRDFDGRRWYHYLTREQRRHCQVCGLFLVDHPLRACWRDVR